MTQRFPVSLGLLLILLASCSKPQPFKIGFVSSLTGRLADVGLASRDGATLAVEQANQRGGVRGRPVELLVRDDANDAGTAIRVDQELIDAGVAAIVGHAMSSMSVAAAHVVDAAGVVMVSPTTSTDALSGQDDHFFRVFPATGHTARGMATHLLTKNNKRRVAVLYDETNRAYTENWVIQFRSELERGGGQITDSASFRSGDEVAFLELARRALQSAPDGVLIVANAMDTAMLVQQVRKLDQTTQLITAEWASTDQVIEFGGTAAEGLLGSQVFPRSNQNPPYLAFCEDYSRRFGREHHFAAVAAYDATSVVLKALAEQRDGEHLKQTILRVQRFAGLQGEFQIDAHGDVQRSHSVVVVRDGRFAVVE